MKVLEFFKGKTVISIASPKEVFKLKNFLKIMIRLKTQKQLKKEKK